MTVEDSTATDSASDAQFRYWRWRIFYSIFVGYAFFYFSRKSFPLLMPALMADLNLDWGDLGNFGSVLALTYAVGKFSSGVISDKVNPRYMMGFGLLITGVLNILFGVSSSLATLTVIWGINGFFQGFGAPPCAKLLIHWFAKRERGRWWSFWNISHNIGGALIPLLVAFCVSRYGWRWGMITPGIICVIGGLVLINRLRDTPESLGFSAVEEEERGKETKTLSVRQILFDQVLTNRFILMLGTSYFFVYVIRTGINDWSPSFLMAHANYTLPQATRLVFWFEIGGLLGSLAAGWASDSLFRSRRTPVNILYMAGAPLALVAFWKMAGVSVFLDSAFLFTIGFLIFGPQMLVGMAAAEVTSKQAAATATGFVGAFAYMGAAAAGRPLAEVIKAAQWDGFFSALIACSVITIILLIPLLYATNDNERTREEKAEPAMAS